MTFFRAGTRLNIGLNSTLLVLFCLMQAQWIPMTHSTHCSMHCSCGMACCRSNVHGRASHSSTSNCAGHQGEDPADECSISCNCCGTVPLAMLPIAKAVLADDFSLPAPDARCENSSLRCAYALSGFPSVLLRPPTATNL